MRQYLLDACEIDYNKTNTADSSYGIASGWLICPQTLFFSSETNVKQFQFFFFFQKFDLCVRSNLVEKFYSNQKLYSNVIFNRIFCVQKNHQMSLERLTVSFECCATTSIVSNQKTCAFLVHHIIHTNIKHIYEANEHIVRSYFMILIRLSGNDKENLASGDTLDNGGFHTGQERFCRH